jgi:rhamnosyltransferase
MKILAHVHTLNDEEVIDRSLEALLQQTYPVQEILVVDNGSTDHILEKLSLKPVTTIHHLENRGTSGSVKTGMQYAICKQYDWIWVLDADSLPRPDALERLVDLYESFDRETRGYIGVLSSSHVLVPSLRLFQGRRLTPKGPRFPKIDPTRPYHECDSTIWSGSLISLEAVRAVGFPRCGTVGYWEDLSLDYGDMEFCYRIRQAGYKVLVHRFSLIDHPVGQHKQIYILGLSLVSTNHSVSRRYLYFRNLVYFWLFLYPQKNWFMLGIWFLCRLMVTLLGIAIMENNRVPKVLACLRGIWDGLHRNLHYRYE